jgi:hypothetical protein
MKQLATILILTTVVYACFNAGRRKDVSVLTDAEKHALMEGCDIGEVIDSDISGKSFRIITCGQFSDCLTGCGSSSAQSIQQRYNGMFEIKEKAVFDEEFDEYLKFSILYYKNSYIAVYRQEGTTVVSDREITLEDNIISAEIKDADIMLNRTIHAGMTKDGFFGKIFNNAGMYDFKHIDTFQNSPPIDGLTQDFIFRNDTLERIVLSSDFDLIPLDSILSPQ